MDGIRSERWMERRVDGWISNVDGSNYRSIHGWSVDGRSVDGMDVAVDGGVTDGAVDGGVTDGAVDGGVTDGG
jgi:hypothetical protein